MNKKIVFIVCLLVTFLCVFAACGDKGGNKEVSDFEIVKGEFPTSYEQGASYDLSLLSLKVTYSDGSTGSVPVVANMVSGMDTKTVGDKNIVVTFQGKSKSFTVTVYDPSELPFDVSFEIEGESVESISVKNGRNLTNPPAPVKSGKVFAGWYTDENFDNPVVWNQLPITASMTVYGRWAVSAEGEVVLSATVNENFSKRILPSVYGYTFENWYRDAECKIRIAEQENVVYDSSRETPLVIYSKWERNVYKISYKNAAVGEGFVTEYNVESEEVILPELSRGWVTFEGWFSDLLYTEEVNAVPFGTTGDKVFYAKWSYGADFVSIDTIEKLNAVKNNPSGKYYLTASIDFEGGTFTPIGTNTLPFTGIFDGNGYTVSNFTISSGNAYGGFFGYNDGQIGAFSVNGCVIGSAPADGIYGGICGINTENGKIDDCSASMSLYAPNLVYGMIAGKNQGEISNCTAQGEIFSGKVGGICGVNTGKVVNCNSNITASSKGEVNLTALYAGGLVGENDGGIVEDSFSKGSITVAAAGNNAYVGGLVGYSHGTSELAAKISNCISTVVVDAEETGNLNAGGFVGYNSYSDITKSYSCGDVKAESGTTGYVGGFVGNNSFGKLTSCFTISILNVVNVTAHGFAGYSSANVATNCYRYEFQGLDNDTDESAAARAFSDINKADFFVNVLGWTKGAESDLKILDAYEIGASSARPILISTVNELKNIVGNVRLYYRLENDMNLGGAEWSGINLVTLESGFDGNGHRIYNFQITAPATGGYTGFFGTNNGTVKNIFLDDFSINVSALQRPLILGGLIGYNKGTLKDCIITGSVVGRTTDKSLITGGAVGLNIGEIENVLVFGTVSGTFGSGSDENDGKVGGLVGNSVDGSVENCYRYAEQGVFPENNEDGSEAGYDAAVSANWYKDELKLNSRWDHTALATSIHSYITAKSNKENPINIDTKAKLLAIEKNTTGYYRLTVNVDLDGAAWTPINLLTDRSGFDGNGLTVSDYTISGFINSGYSGFFGMVEGEVLNLNLDESEISFSGSGEMRVGGAIACLRGKAESVTSTSEINVSATKLYVGGAIGYSDGGTILSCKDKSTVTSSIYGRELYGGGIVGYAYGGNIKNCSVEDSNYAGVKAYTKLKFGGIVGQLEGSSVEDCTARATVNCSVSTAPDGGNASNFVRVGGIVGEAASPVKNSRSECIVTVKAQIAVLGGIVGYMAQNSEVEASDVLGGSLKAESDGTDAASYAAAGGIVGYNFYGSVKNCDVTLAGAALVVIAKADKVAFAGGIAARNASSTGISGSRAKADVYAESLETAYSGGAVGENKSIISLTEVLTGSKAKSSAKDAYLGGFVGANFKSITSSSVGSGVEILASSGENLVVGGFVGEQNAEGVISDCNASGIVGASVTGYLKAGGFVGNNLGSTGKNHTSAALDVESEKKAYVGGFVGVNASVLSLCYATGEVKGRTVSEVLYIGGFAGNNTSAIAEVYTLSAVIGAADNSFVVAAGFIGLNSAGARVEKSFCAGNTTILTFNGDNRFSQFGCYEVGGNSVDATCFYRDETVITVDGQVTENITESWGKNKTPYNDPLTETFLKDSGRFLTNELGLDWSANDWTFAAGEYPVLK